MKRTFAIAALVLPLLAAPLRAGGPSDDFRAKFKPYEQWMLDVVLSDPKQKAAFDVDAVAGQKGGADAERVEMKWRKTLIAFATYYKRKLDTTDIIPNAESVEKMVSPEEFNITQYYWLRKPEKEREQFKSDIATGNGLLNWGGRKVVEGKVRAGRQTFSGDIAQYLNDPDAKKALAWTEPPPKPVTPPDQVAQQPVAQQPSRQPQPPPKKPVKEPVKEPDPTTVKPENPNGARDQLDNIARNTPSGSGEGGAERAGSGFTGGGSHPQGPGSPIDAVPVGTPNLVAPPPEQLGLGQPNGAPQGGFVVAPPPAPVLDQNKKNEQGASKFKMYAVKYGPGVIGGLLGGALLGILGGILLGPFGAIGGALLGAALGYKGGKAIGNKLLGTE